MQSVLEQPEQVSLLELKSLRAIKPKTPTQHREIRERIVWIGLVMGLIEEKER